MTTQKKIIGIVITTYNVKKRVLENIAGCFNQQTIVGYEILVVDSGSTDGTTAEIRRIFPNVNVFFSPDNIGSAKSRNIGIRQFPGIDVLFLDSDIVMEPDAVQKLVECVDNNVGQVCGTLYSPDKSVQCTAFRKPGLISMFARLFYFESHLPRRLREKYSVAELSVKSKPFWTSGGFTLVTADAIAAAGMKDEDFFVYGEELEHAHRLRDNGFDIVYTPEARALHYGSSSTLQNMENCRYDAYRGNLLYWKKRQPQKFPFALSIVLLRLIFVICLSPLMVGKNRWEVFRSHRDVVINLVREFCH